MHKLEVKYPNINSRKFESSFYLTSSKEFNLFEWQPPINWEGKIGSKRIKFTQISHEGFNCDCFDWQDFPKEMDYLKPYIVESINKTMKVMD